MNSLKSSADHRLRRWLEHGTAALCVALLLLLVWSLHSALAQSPQDTQAPDETIMLKAGTVFEIKAETTDKEAFLSWVLTRDRSFIEAGREPVFAVRLTEPGTYLLETAADFLSTGDRVRKNITIAVAAQGNEAPAIAAPAGTLVRTTPLASGGKISFTGSSSILTITPMTPAAGALHVDTDTGTDTDRDGDPGNDDDAAGTLFSKEGNPLSLWFVLPTDHQVRVWGGGPDGQSKSQTLQLTHNGTPAADVPVSGDIEMSDTGNGDMLFSFETGDLPENIVHQWNFGDGGQSLQRSPLHHYRLNGIYDVAVRVQSLLDGRTVDEAQTSVHVTSANPVTGTGAGTISSSSSSAASVPEPEDNGKTNWIPLVLEILFIALIAIAVGMLGMWLIGKFLRKGGGLAKRLEDAEAKLVKGGKGAIDVAPPPLTLRRSEDAATSIETELAASTDRSPPSPPLPPPTSGLNVDIDKAPSWLKKGFEKKPDTPATPPSAPESPPAPEPSIPSPPAQALASAVPPPPGSDEFATNFAPSSPPALPTMPEPTPAPIATPEPSFADQTLTPAPLPTEEETLPPWLQSQPAAVETTAPAPQPPASPAPPPEPPFTPAAVEPAPTPEPEPEVSPEPAPPAPLEPTAPPPPLPVAVIEPQMVQAPPPAFANAVAPIAPPIEEQLPPAAPTLQPTPAPVSAPEPVTPEPAPEQEFITTPPAPPAVLPAASAPATPAVPTEEDLKREEAERERKRRKRQRYRENLKKRAEEAELKTAGAPAQETPAPVPVPPVTPPPAAPTPAPVASETQPMTPAAAPNSQLSTDNSQPPVEYDIPLAETPIVTSTPAVKSDDSVAFVIKAEGVTQENPKAQDPNSQGEKKKAT